MSKRPRRNHSPTFKAKVALAAFRGDKPKFRSSLRKPMILQYLDCKK
jgi:transposase-like protein